MIPESDKVIIQGLIVFGLPALILLGSFVTALYMLAQTLHR